MNKNSTILIVGHNGIIEKSLFEHFEKNGFKNVFSSSNIGLDTTIQASVYDFFARHKPEFIFLSSVKSGGIDANQRFPADFIYQNLESQNNIIYASLKFSAKKVMYIASSCVYPKECPQPMKEEYLMTGKMEETSEPYSTAKLAGIKLCQSFKKQYGLNCISIIPATVYGPFENNDPRTSHVMGAFISRFIKAQKENAGKVVLWGTGEPRREFTFKDDFVNACLCLMEKYNEQEPINVGVGYDISIKELARIVSRAAGFKGEIVFDKEKPDGAMRKFLDNSKIKKLGFQEKTDLDEGIRQTLLFELNHP